MSDDTLSMDLSWVPGSIACIVTPKCLMCQTHIKLNSDFFEVLQSFSDASAGKPHIVKCYQGSLCLDEATGQ